MLKRTFILLLIYSLNYPLEGIAQNPSNNIPCKDTIQLLLHEYGFTGKAEEQFKALPNGAYVFNYRALQTNSLVKITSSTKMNQISNTSATYLDITENPEVPTRPTHYAVDLNQQCQITSMGNRGLTALNSERFYLLGSECRAHLINKTQTLAEQKNYPHFGPFFLSICEKFPLDLFSESYRHNHYDKPEVNNAPTNSTINEAMPSLAK